MKHDLIKTGDPDAFDSILDADDEVVLDFCRRCGRGEGDLEPECPGRVVSVSTYTEECSQSVAVLMLCEDGSHWRVFIPFEDLVAKDAVGATVARVKATGWRPAGAVKLGPKMTAKLTTWNLPEFLQKFEQAAPGAPTAAASAAKGVVPDWPDGTVLEVDGVPQDPPTETLTEFLQKPPASKVAEKAEAAGKKQKFVGGDDGGSGDPAQFAKSLGEAFKSREVLDTAASEIAKLAEEMHARQTNSRGAWMSIGAALWRARDACGSKQEFGAWIKESGIDKLPGLSSAASRSDAIWMVEHHEQADLIPMEISHPKAVREAWRKLFAGEVKTAVADLVEAGTEQAPDAISVSAGEVDKATHSGVAAAEEAIKAAIAKIEDGSAGELPDLQAKLVKAIKKAKADGLSGQHAIGAVGLVYGYEGLGDKSAWAPQEGWSAVYALQNAMSAAKLGTELDEQATLDDAVALLGIVWPESSALVALLHSLKGHSGFERAGVMAAVDAVFPEDHVTVSETVDRLKAALAAAEAKGIGVDDVRDAVMDVFWKKETTQ